jgi:hypothetical protein
MGPGFISPEDGWRTRRSNTAARASMGPGFISPEDPGEAVELMMGMLLQWDRASSARKTVVACDLTGEPARLQWDRASSARKTSRWPYRRWPARWLQWDRASSARKTLPVLHFASVSKMASMGPGFISPEDRCRSRACLLTRRFNGTGLHQPGRHQWAGAIVGPLKRLQWDRASSARKTYAIPPDASKFPELQWDRASSARKTAALARCALVGSCAASSEREPPRGLPFGFSPGWRPSVSLELSKSTSMPGTSFHHRRTRGVQPSKLSVAGCEFARCQSSALIAHHSPFSIHDPPFAIIPNPRCRPAPSASGPATGFLKYSRT